MKPLTRKEFFMAKAAGQSVPDLEPITREEYFLDQIAESGGGGGGGGGIPAITEADEGKVLTVDDGAAVWAEGGGGSSDPYDFVIKCLGSFKDLNLNQLNIEKGTLQDIEEKIHDDQNPVTGCLVQYRQVNDPSLGYVLFEKYDLIYVDVYYRHLTFASQRNKDANGGGLLTLYYDEYYVINDYYWTE